MMFSVDLSLGTTGQRSGLTCGTPTIQPSVSSNRVSGGVDAVKHSWPWQCYIQIDKGNGYTKRCGGSVIGDRWILTAGHCL